MPAINKLDKAVVMPDVDLAASRDSGDVIVNEKRRHLAKFALGAPVLVTLASRPVLAGPCLSNWMSGNLSHPDPGNCSLGSSPGALGMPGGKINSIYSTVGAWTAVGLSYGTYTPEKSVPSLGKMQSTAVGLNDGDHTPAICSPSNPNRYDCYVGGATLEDVPVILNQGGLPTGTLLREVLTAPQLDQLTRHLICAYLNALLGALPGSSFRYVLTPQQVLDLANGAIPLPTGYSSLNDFLDSTWT